MTCIHCSGTGMRMVGSFRSGMFGGPIVAPCSKCDAVEKEDQRGGEAARQHFINEHLETRKRLAENQPGFQP